MVLILFNVCFNQNGGAKGDRTPDLLIANQTLSQLSYSPTSCMQIAGGRLFRQGECWPARRQAKQPSLS